MGESRPNPCPASISDFDCTFPGAVWEVLDACATLSESARKSSLEQNAACFTVFLTAPPATRLSFA